MKVTIDLDFGPGRRKRWVLRLGLPLLALGIAGLAYASSLPKTWKTGDTLSADDLNNNFSNLDGRVAALEARSVTPSGFLANLTSGAVTLKQYSDVILTPANVVFDLNSEYAAGTGTFSPKNAGIYLLTCGFWLSPSGAGQMYSAGLRVNGTDLANSDTHASSTAGFSARAVTIAKLAAGDQVICKVYTTDAAGVIPDGHLEEDLFAAMRLN